MSARPDTAHTATAQAIVATGISATLGRRQILTDVDLDAPAGSIVAVIGPNGSGKSTLLRCIVGLLAPTHGRITIGGNDIGALSPRDRARRVAFVPQEADLPPDLLVGEYVALGRLPYTPPWSLGRAGDADAVARALAAVGLADAHHTPVLALSGGERRRVMLARGLAQDCGVLVLDEPTNHLDIRHQLELLTLIRDLGVTVLLAMHDLDLAVNHSDRLYVLCDGTIRVHGTPDVLDETVLSDVFGVTGRRLHDPATGRTHLVFAADPTPTPSKENS